MKTVTFTLFLLGITGDLAAKKILPALSQHSDKNPDTVVNLLGYSRGAVDKDKIITILDSASKSGKHTIKNIDFKQGSYTDGTAMEEIFSLLSPQDTMIVYLAVPPNIAQDFLAVSCPIQPKNIHIVVEKPFGNNWQEGQRLLATANECSITQNIHFFDHYGFKPSLVDSPDLFSVFESISKKNPISVKVQALEMDTVENRLGYYDQTGALRDMLQHLITLYQSVGLQLNIPALNSHDFKIEQCRVGQYDTYSFHAPNSDTETYFSLQGGVNDTRIFLEAGKNLGKKETMVTIEYVGFTFVWDVQKKSVSIENSDGVKKYQLFDDRKLDHTRLFESILQDDFTRFVEKSDIETMWRILLEVEKKRPPLIVYMSGKYPIQPSK
jgi:glucose-6-phosphate 1-dehydrogenase